MRTVVTVLVMAAGFPALWGTSAWLRGPAYEAPFVAAELSPPPPVRVGLGRTLGVPAVRIRIEGPVRALDAGGSEVLWEGPGLDVEASAAPAPGPGLRLAPVGAGAPAGEEPRPGRVPRVEGPRPILLPADEVVLVPARDGALRVGGRDARRYRGALRLLVRGPNRLLAAVNEVDLEHYLASVVGSEMADGWPPEALKAQAVAARTYALHQIRAGAARAAQGFDLYDDDRSQVYNGLRNEAPETVLAARETRGEACYFGGRIFKAFYQNTCGGRTEPARIVFAEQSIPPLEGRVCAWCAASPHYRWRVEVSKLELAAKLFDSKKFGPVPAVRVLERTPGGLVLKIGVISPLGRRNEIAMSGREFRSKVDPKRFKSLAFDAADAGDRFVFTGRGWGHLVGLCQEGARGYAAGDPGADYRTILEYYYPGAAVDRAY
jgi:stage II sporulation protein D